MAVALLANDRLVWTWPPLHTLQVHASPPPSSIKNSPVICWLFLSASTQNHGLVKNVLGLSSVNGFVRYRVVECPLLSAHFADPPADRPVWSFNYPKMGAAFLRFWQSKDISYRFTLQSGACSSHDTLLSIVLFHVLAGPYSVLFVIITGFSGMVYS